MDLLQLEKILLKLPSSLCCNETRTIFDEFFKTLDIASLLENYLYIFGGVDPSKHEKYVPEEVKKATITPISIIFFDNERFKLSIRELHRSDKIIASDSEYQIKALSELNLELFKFDLGKLLSECWEERISNPNQKQLVYGDNITINQNTAFYYSGEDIKLILVLEQKPLASTRAIYNSSTLDLEQIASNSIESDRRNEALKAVINILDRKNIKLSQDYKKLLNNLLDDKYFSIRWNAARLLINNVENTEEKQVIEKLINDSNNFIRNKIKQFSEGTRHA